MLDARQERGLRIAAISKIEKNPLGWKVPSQSGNGSYVVAIGEKPYCTCPDFESRRQPCKHIYAVEYVIQRETHADGSETYKESVKVTYRQEWPAYNEAQTHEAERFGELLHALCTGVPQEPQTKGRPKLPMSDVIFSAVAKVYSTMSGRRAMTDLRDAQVKGYLARTPHYNSIFNYLENPALTPILKALVEESAKPLKAIESDFAVDSSGFSTCTYTRWYDHKYGKERTKQTWVKTHIMIGVKTNVVTSVEATPTESGDAAQFPTLVERTAKSFAIKEVSADKAYSSKRNHHVVDAIGGTAYIPFKSNASANLGHHKFDGLWQYMMAHYNYNRAAFLEHYHKRSNVETTFSMIKAKFGGSVRSKSPVAQVNEVLCKVLAHNICVLIQSIYELHLEPTFWADMPVAQKVA